MTSTVLMPSVLLSQRTNLETRATVYSRLLRTLEPGEVDPHLIMKANLTLPALVRSLERIKNGTYGICIVCEEPIDPRRLMLIPAAERCQPCQCLKEGGTP